MKNKEMINPKDLRLGNVVNLYEGKNLYMGLQPIGVEQMILLFGVGPDVIHAEGIPLTEDILFRMGALRAVPDGFDWSDGNWTLGYIHIALLYDRFVAQMYKHQVEVKWVHQLQNLVFALEKRELTLNPISNG